MSQSTTQKLPSVFISHGGVGFTLDPKSKYFQSLQKFSADNKLFERTKNVILISGHFEAKEVTINLKPNPKIIHDHPCEWLFKYAFRFETNVELAKQIKSRLEQNKITTKTTSSEDVDHGGWGGLFALFDIDKHQKMFDQQEKSYSPKIVQVSLHSGMDTAFHHKLGQILDEFRNEDTMILASGSTTHSFTYMRHPQFVDWSKVWEKWLLDVLTNKDENYRKEQLFAVKSHKQYQYMHHSDDHFMPLLVSLGTSHNPATLIGQELQYQINMMQTSYAFV